MGDARQRGLWRSRGSRSLAFDDVDRLRRSTTAGCLQTGRRSNRAWARLPPNIVLSANATSALAPSADNPEPHPPAQRSAAQVVAALISSHI
jgi:hypothetical protein